MPELLLSKAFRALDRERGPVEVDSAHAALRAHVRMRLAFWSAQDRRSITTGPGWLWRGQQVAPLRQVDLSTATRALIERRRAAGVATADLFATAGPRQHRLPRWASVRSAASWSIAAGMLVLVALVCVRAADGRGGIVQLAGWGAAVCSAVAVTVIGLLVWAQRDPLKLSPTQAGEVHAARRVLDWNPLAGQGPITAGGAYLLEGIAAVTDVVRSPAWALPDLQVTRWRFDPDEEIFQIARAAYCVDEHETVMATLAEVVPIEGLAATLARAERRHLTDALLNRLLILHWCVGTLADIERRSRQVSAAETDTAGAQLFSAAAENELAAVALSDLNTDLIGFADLYGRIGAAGVDNRLHAP